MGLQDCHRSQTTTRSLSDIQGCSDPSQPKQPPRGLHSEPQGHHPRCSRVLLKGSITRWVETIGEARPLCSSLCHRAANSTSGSSRGSPSASPCTSCLSVWSTFHHQSSCLLALEDEVHVPGHVPQAQEIGLHRRLPPHFHMVQSIGHILDMRNTEQVDSHFLCTWKSSCQSFVKYFRSPASPWVVLWWSL